VEEDETLQEAVEALQRAKVEETVERKGAKIKGAKPVRATCRVEEVFSLLACVCCITRFTIGLGLRFQYVKAAQARPHMPNTDQTLAAYALLLGLDAYPVVFVSCPLLPFSSLVLDLLTLHDCLALALTARLLACAHQSRSSIMCADALTHTRSLTQALEPIMSAGQAIAEFDGVTFDYFNAPNLPLVEADTRVLQEAVSNVLDNALKYVLVRGDDGSHPRVSFLVQRCHRSVVCACDNAEAHQNPEE
jgi:hypothetical protein